MLCFECYSICDSLLVMMEIPFTCHDGNTFYTCYDGNTFYLLGSITCTKFDEFGGTFPIQKISLRFFRKFWGGKTMNLRKKGGCHANRNEFRCKFSGLPKKAQHSFPKIGWGGSEAVWKFSENSSNLVQVVTPKVGMI